MVDEDKSVNTGLLKGEYRLIFLDIGFHTLLKKCINLGIPRVISG